MNFLPSFTNSCLKPLQLDSDLRDFPVNDTVILAQNNVSAGAVHLKHCFHSLADHVNVFWAMVVRVDHDTKTSETDYRWHETNLSA